MKKYLLALVFTLFSFAAYAQVPVCTTSVPNGPNYNLLCLTATPTGGNITLTNVGTATGGLSIPSPGISNLTVTGSFTATGLVTNSDLVSPTITVNTVPCTLGSTCTISAATSLVVGSTVVGSGVTNQILYDNGGVLGEITKGNSCLYGTNGTGVPSCLTTLPTGLTAPSWSASNLSAAGLTVTSSFTATGLVTNADLANPATTVNGVTCTLGSTCSISAAASLVLASTTVTGGTTNQFLYDNGGVLGEVTKGNSCVYGTNGSGVPSCVTTLPFTVSLATGGTNANLTASNGGIAYSTASAVAILSGTATANLPLLSGSSTTPSWATISYPASATSGGIPYFSSSSAITSSGVLAANAIVIGGGAGAAPTTTGCTISSVNAITCSSASAFEPQMILQNTTSDNNNAYLIYQKSRSGGAVQNGDALAKFLIQPFVNGSYQSTASITWFAVGAPSGNSVPTEIQFNTSSTTALANTFLFDNNAHLLVSSTNVPTLTAGCSGAGSSVASNSSDFAGNATGQTAAATTCTITFANAFSVTPSCVVTGDQSQPTAITRGTSTLVVTFASTANYRFSWNCVGT